MLKDSVTATLDVSQTRDHKRFLLAMASLQGQRANPHANSDSHYVVGQAIEDADIMLKALESEIPNVER